MSEKSIMVPKNEQNPRFGEINEHNGRKRRTRKRPSIAKGIFDEEKNRPSIEMADFDEEIYLSTVNGA